MSSSSWVTYSLLEEALLDKNCREISQDCEEWGRVKNRLLDHQLFSRAHPNSVEVFVCTQLVYAGSMQRSVVFQPCENNCVWELISAITTKAKHCSVDTGCIFTRLSWSS